MKTTLSLLTSLCLIASALATPFSYQLYNSDGSPQTNVITMQAWPPSTNRFTVYGTNIIFGNYGLTLTPSTNGYGTNFAYPNSYRCYVSNGDYSFYVLLPDSTQQLALGSCLVSAPQVAGPLTWYGILTNAFGFAPLASNALAVKGALTYTPATNSPAGISNAMGFGAATNTPTGIAGALGFAPATNTSSGILAALTFVPATNSPAGISNALGYVPAQQGGSILESQLPQIGYIGVTNLNGAMITNRATGQIILWTNLATGITPTIALPDGSLILTTNGSIFTRSNATAINLK